MKISCPAFQAISLICICAFAGQAWTFQKTTYNSSNRNQDPEAVLCGLTPAGAGSKFKYKVSISQLSVLDSFCVQYSAGIDPRIIQFNLTVIPVKGRMEQVNCSRNRFNKAVKDLISKLASGDILFFDGIKAQDRYRRKINLSPVSILVM